MYQLGMPPLRRAVAGLAGRQLTLSLHGGGRRGASGEPVPYGIAPGVRVRPATYLDLEIATILPGQELPVHGQLRTLTGIPVAGARIVLQSLTSSRAAQSETSLAAAVTDSDGHFSATLHPDGNLLLRALHAPAPAVVSALLVVGVRPVVTFGAVFVNGTVQVSGTVDPPKPHVLLEISHTRGSRRIEERRVIAADGGVFTAQLRLSAGRFTIRAVVQADAGTLAGESPAVTLEL